MLHRVIAEEGALAAPPAAPAAAEGAAAAAPALPADTPPAIETLNWAPGPMETDMVTPLVQGVEVPGVHKSTTDFFAKAKAEGSLVDIEASAAKCARIVLGGAFKSGDHLDFFETE
jgi:hypothetical protein